MCRSYCNDELVGKESSLQLFSLAHCELVNAQGAVIEMLVENVKKEAAKRLKYPTPRREKVQHQGTPLF